MGRDSNNYILTRDTCARAGQLAPGPLQGLKDGSPFTADVRHTIIRTTTIRFTIYDLRFKE